MHELSLCQDVIEQLTALAEQHGAAAVGKVTVRVGALSGVEPVLLDFAFLSARTATVADQADFQTEWVPPRVRCRACGTEAEVVPNDLRCPACLSHETDLTRGDELMLASVELLVPDHGPPAAATDHLHVKRGH